MISIEVVKLCDILEETFFKIIFKNYIGNFSKFH